jgi:hypothetical protein
MLRTHPAETSEALNEVMITGKATAMAVPLIDPINSARLATAKTRYLDMGNTIYLFRKLYKRFYSTLATLSPSKEKQRQAFAQTLKELREYDEASLLGKLKHLLSR